MATRRGFTLIELLVVIAIIGIIATIAIVSYGNVRGKARDTKRMADMKTFTNAIELYADQNGHYPISGSPINWVSFDAPTYMNNPIVTPDAGNLTAALSSWLGPGLKDPRRTGSNSSGYLYRSNSAGTEFCFLVYLTPEDLNNYPVTLWNPYRCSAVDANGVCTAAGTTYGPQQSVFIGSPAYSSVGC